jgi:hypothetical protein
MISMDEMHKAYESRGWSSIKWCMDHAPRCFRHHLEHFWPMYRRYTLVPFRQRWAWAVGLQDSISTQKMIFYSTFWCIGRGDWLGGAFGLRVKSIGLLQEQKISHPLAWMAVNTRDMYTCVYAVCSVKFSHV